MSSKRLFAGLASLLLVLALTATDIYAQKSKRITGTVVDATTNTPVMYASLSVKNSTSGTVTESDGSFSLDIDLSQNDKITLIVSHISFYRQELTITGSDASKDIYIFLEPKSVDLTEVVVSARLYEQPLDKLAQSASLITHREIIDKMNSNITDVLSSTPGFTQVWEYHSPIILRGLNSNRLIIMKDGNRRIGTFPGGYFGQDMNIYDTKKLEIVKGPGSVVYGSGAISGIVNIISNEPFGTDKNRVQLHSGYGSNNNEFLELVKLCHQNESFGISLNGKYRETGNMLYGDGEIADNSNVEDRDFSLNTGYRFNDHHKVILNANYHYGDWGKPRGFNGPTKRFTQIRNNEENIHSDLSYSYTPGGLVESIHLNLYYDNGRRDYYQYKYTTMSNALSSLDLVHYKSQYGGGRLYSVINQGKSSKLSLGLDGYMFRLSNPSDLFDYYNHTEGKLEGYHNAGQQDIGFFINEELNISEIFRIVGGIRYDAARVIEGENSQLTNRNESRNAFSGNLGFVYSINPDNHISLNGARAFRMPTTEELFTRVISCKGIKVGNPELKPEYSWNIDLGVRGKLNQNRLKYDLALFYNILDDFINEAPDADNPDIDFSYKNTDAVLFGGEFSFSYRFADVFKPSNSLYLGLGSSYVYGIDMSVGENEPLFGMPPFNTMLNLNYKGKLSKSHITGYSVKLECKYAAAQNRIAAVPEGTEGGPWGYKPSDSNAIFYLSFGINSNSLPGYPKLRIIANNLLNTDYQPFGSYIPAMGRNIKILLSFSF